MSKRTEEQERLEQELTELYLRRKALRVRAEVRMMEAGYFFLGKWPEGPVLAVAGEVEAKGNGKAKRDFLNRYAAEINRDRIDMKKGNK